MQCLIVAAGQGSRLRAIAPCKPLAPVLGVPLIERVIGAAAEGGATEFVVVTGYEGDRVEQFLSALAARSGFKISCQRNANWQASNGLSVLSARPHLGDRFALLMSDHLFDPTILGDLAATAPNLGATLAIDRRLDNPLVDLDDVTRVDLAGAGLIRGIGKGLGAYNAFDTGVFVATPALMDAIQADVDAGGTGGISDGMRRLARQDLAFGFEIGDRFWLDVDDAVAFGHAERTGVRPERRLEAARP